MFKNFFKKPPPKKAPQNIEMPPTLLQQKELMDQNSPLLSDVQIKKIKQNIKQSSSPPPFCLNNTSDVPFRILYDGANIYVLSDIILGEGGEGIMRAGQIIEPTGKSSWLAIKECFSGKELRELVITLISDENMLMENYEPTLRGMYLEKYPDSDYDELSQKELIEFFKNRLLKEVIPETQKKSLEDALKNKTILNDFGIPATVFATDMLVYSTMPLLRGNDLVMLSGAKEANPTAIFDQIMDSAKNNPDDSVQWGPFVTGYARVINNILEQVSEFHRKNYLHRDIKPHNLMLIDTGKVQLIDFGSAVKMQDGVYTANDSTISTPAYTSPEQAKFAQAHPKDDYTFTRADDIYSLGITLQELYAQKVVEVIFKLYPDLEEKFIGIQAALAGLNAPEPKERMHAMDFLSENFQHLVQALEVKQGLIVQHDDNYDKLVGSIDHYRLACYESKSQSSDVSLIIDGTEFSSKFAHDLLMGDLSSETIAKNLLIIKQQYQANPDITADDVITSIDRSSSLTL
ncbi:hypothetical protein FOLKNPGA_01698 [Legionella sp. PC1000]|uniref:protein kinase domain-containing protein n=1 Tax=Legionella sp. PC1000 TaxID=2746060 RepID=UPI0015F92D08|nr:protein kinase [Legionella sp. PC1000]QLZ68918.1 hypothetical protein FOLKNPGA_01698 [Legionella sp. PC1000]